MTEKKGKEKKNKCSVRKPSFFVYCLPIMLAGWFFRLKWHVHIDKKDLKRMKGLKEPIIAIGNHSSTIDIVMAIIALFPKRFNIVTGKDLFTWKALKPFIKAFGAIPKNQCAIDLSFMKHIKDAADHGRNILLYPEGKTSLDGKELRYLGPQIAKFIKFLDCGLVIIHTDGSYLTHPRYYKGFRTGRVDMKLEFVGTKDEIKAMPNGELYDKIKRGIAFNDHIWQRENNIRFKCDEPAKNLNYILYKCPKCGAEYRMTSDGHYLTCEECGNRVKYDEYGVLTAEKDGVAFERVDLWYDYERKSCAEELKTEGFEIRKAVTLMVDDGENADFVERGKGELYLVPGEIGYVGNKDGEEVVLKQNLKNMNTVVTKNVEGIDLMFDEHIYRFLFDEKKYSTKYGLLIEENYIIQNKISL